ncbi:type 2 DNA topoisomerase 6 subunit B-like [Rhea pennata]|uniref:type 2 DNA topoisomerase 6 subunit B-like n=1 Tax=Rhea pennata TaxID=8795 RepID=UPI002E25C2A7
MEWPWGGLKVLERLLLRLQPVAGGQPGRGTLLVALSAEGDAGDAGAARCTATVAAAGEICSEIRSEGVWSGANEVLAQFGARSAAPQAVAPCCRQILHRAPLQLAFEVLSSRSASAQLSPRPGTLRAGCVALRRFIHGTSVVHPELVFHYCFRMDGAVSSHAYGPARRENVCELGGARLLARSEHFARPESAGDVPLCSKIHPVPGAPIGLRIPPAAAAAGVSGELSVLPAAALCPCLKQYPNLPSRLTAVAISCCRRPRGSRQAARKPALPSWCWDQEVPLLALTSGTCSATTRLGCRWRRAAPSSSVTHRGWRTGADLVLPASTFVLQPDLAPAGPQQTLLLFLFLRRADPFQAYDAWARRLLASHLEPTLQCSREALQRGVRALLHPALEELGRRAQQQACLARCLPVALRALSSVMASSTSARFRRRCLRTLQAADTLALAAAARQRLLDVTRWRRLPAGSCDAAGPREAEEERPGGPANHEDTETGSPPDAVPERDGPSSDPPDAWASQTPGPPQCLDAAVAGPPAEGAAWLREVAKLAEWTG